MIAFPAERTYLQNEPIVLPRRAIVESTDRSPRPESQEGSERRGLEFEAREREGVSGAPSSEGLVATEGKGTLIDVLG